MSTHSRQHTHVNALTSMHSHQRTHVNALTSTHSRQRTHVNALTSMHSRQGTHVNALTSTHSCQRTHVNALTSTHSRQHTSQHSTHHHCIGLKICWSFRSTTCFFFFQICTRGLYSLSETNNLAAPLSVRLQSSLHSLTLVVQAKTSKKHGGQRRQSS